MKLEDFHSGMRVFVKQGNVKVYGTAGTMRDGEIVSVIVRLDSGRIVKVKEEYANLFETDPLN